MRPYLAIIKDSFRAAMASRVLYVLLLLITLLLIVLAPLHMRETLDWELNRQTNLRNPERLLRRIVERHDQEGEKPIARIWELLPAKTRDKMVEIVERPEGTGLDDPDVPGAPPKVIEDIHTYEELIVQLNQIIENPDFYRAEDWEGRNLPSEAEDLIDQGVDRLSEIRGKRLNRLLVSTAVSPAIDTGSATALDFYYAVWRIPITVGRTHQQFAKTLTSELPWYFEKLVLSIGLLIAIIVTANMIPETFEPGSLNLLLSKPISRWGLYTAKFFGGCIFIALCAGYLFFGIWLWMGIAMGVWDRAVLLSIPLYVIVFAIYFSVSAFVGLIWRSSTVSVILTLLFWAFCFSIGSVYGVFNTKMKNSELINLTPVENDIYASDLLHQLAIWDDAEGEWVDKLEAELGEQGAIAFGINSYLVSLREIPAFPGLDNFLAPHYDQQESRMIASRYEFGQSMSSGKKKLFVSDTEELKFKDVGYFPRDTVQLFQNEKGVMAVSSDGSFYRLESENFERAIANHSPGESAPSANQTASRSGIVEQDSDQNKDIKKAKSGNSKPVELFTRIGPDSPLSIRSASQVDYNHVRDEFAVYQRGVVKVFRADGEKYVLHATLKLDLSFGRNMTCLLAYQGETILLAFGNGKVISVDALTMVEKNEYQPESRSAIEGIGGSRDGQHFAVLYRNGRLWSLDSENDNQMQKAEIIGQGHICTFAFGADGTLWVADNTDRVTSYPASGGPAIRRSVPTGTWTERLYRYGLRPFYKLCPKPGEFYKVVTHLSSSGDTEANEDVDLNKSLQPSDPWSPLWSGLAFMFTMIVLGCLVFQFRDY